LSSFLGSAASNVVSSAAPLVAAARVWGLVKLIDEINTEFIWIMVKIVFFFLDFVIVETDL
jgi:hypothetical protein